MLPVLTPESLQDILSRVPANLRAQVQWRSKNVRSSFAPLQRPGWSLAQLDRATRELYGLSFALLSDLHDTSWMDLLMEKVGEQLSRARQAAGVVLSGSIAGAAAEFSLDVLREIALARVEILEVADIDALEEAVGSANLFDLACSEERDFMRGQTAAFIVHDTLMAGSVPEPIRRLACVSAQRFMRGLSHPSLYAIPHPFRDEDAAARGERFMRYAHLAPQAVNDLERQVILELRTTGSGDPTLPAVVSIYDAALKRLA